MWTSRVVLFASLLAAQGRIAWADGGTLRASRSQGDLQVSLFTSPSMLRAGEIDVSVLVQDAAAGRSRTDLPVSIRMERLDAASIPLEKPATVFEATNKLFQAARFDLPFAGTWRASVWVGQSSDPAIVAEFVVAESLPAWIDLAPWIGWPLAVAALFLVHQSIKARSDLRGRRSERLRSMVC